ncbi:MAG: aminotransferase class V-fold PLP-dependent enzyme, partial [Bryobacteraceae bacterium]|nr:aminotransferase class V-fold PLP-dependent enzyme [Bryobacteraceae bacterium]
MKPVYFDHNATTPASPESLEAWIRVSKHVYGNASSIHSPGQEARREIDSARQSVASLLGAASPKEIVFCSGGTEADNAALFGVMRAWAGGAISACTGRTAHLITSAIEHPAIL